MAGPFETTGPVGAVAPGPGSRVSAMTTPGATGGPAAVNDAVPDPPTVKSPRATGTLSGPMAHVV